RDHGRAVPAGARHVARARRPLPQSAPRGPAPPLGRARREPDREPQPRAVGPALPDRDGGPALSGAPERPAARRTGGGDRPGAHDARWARGRAAVARVGGTETTVRHGIWRRPMDCLWGESGGTMLVDELTVQLRRNWHVGPYSGDRRYPRVLDSPQRADR